MEDISIKLEPVGQKSTSEVKDELWSLKPGYVSIKEELVIQIGMPADSLCSIDATIKKEWKVDIDEVDGSQHQMAVCDSFKQVYPDNPVYTEQTRFTDVQTPSDQPFPMNLYQVDCTWRNNNGLNVECDPNTTLKHVKLTGNATQANGKPYKCSLCPYSFSQKSRLKRHTRTHTGSKPYKCPLCHYRCSQTGSLKTHERTHTGERPYKCSLCSYSCSHHGSLNAHRKTHTGEKPYKCSFCQYSCALKCNLTKHERIHTGEKPYKCPYCPYSSPHQDNLKMHERVHTGEKPYKCPLCPGRFSQSGTLRKHERLHSGEKPYKC